VVRVLREDQPTTPEARTRKKPAAWKPSAKCLSFKRQAGRQAVAAPGVETWWATAVATAHRSGQAWFTIDHLSGGPGRSGGPVCVWVCPDQATSASVEIESGVCLITIPHFNLLVAMAIIDGCLSATPSSEPIDEAIHRIGGARVRTITSELKWLSWHSGSPSHVRRSRSNFTVSKERNGAKVVGALLARYVLSSCVCPSVWHKSEFYQNG